MAMRSYTKRAMEGFILFVALLMLYFMLYAYREKPKDVETGLQLVKEIHQRAWETYGPGVNKPYYYVFAPAEVYSPTIDRIRPLYMKVSNAVGASRLLGFGSSQVAIDDAPLWFNEMLDECEPFLLEVDNACRQGPYLFPPQYISMEYRNSFIRNHPDFAKMQVTALGLGLLTTREWNRGNHQEAQKYMERARTLADSFRLSPRLMDLLIRFVFINVTNHRLGSLILSNPQAQANKAISDTSNNVMGEAISGFTTPKGTDQSYSDALIGWMATFLLGNQARHDLPIPQTRINSDLMAAGLLMSYHFGNTNEAALMYPILHLPYERHMTYEETCDALQKWTTVPAMRKRAGKALSVLPTDNSIQDHRVISQISPLVILASLYGGNAEASRYPAYIEYMVGSYHAINSAFRARVWYDDNGVWPSEQIFRASVSDSTALQWHSLQDSSLFARMYKELLRPDQPNTILVSVSDDGNSATLVYKLPAIENGRIHYVNTPDNVVLTDEILESWVRGIFAKQPLVESITKTENRKLNIHLRIPETTYWVTHPGPDGVSDGPSLEYDPTNGTVSRGDIVQLAGWE